jgi:hypothetical protein
LANSRSRLSCIAENPSPLSHYLRKNSGMSCRGRANAPATDALRGSIDSLPVGAVIVARHP